MGIPNLKRTLKTNLKKDIENENSGGSEDKRKLNYYSMKEGEKMRILFVPDENGEFWSKFSLHGPQLKINGADGKPRGVRGVNAINCSYKSSAEDCPACQKGFDLFAQAKDTGDKSYKEEGKKWMPKDYTLTSCIVLDSPVEVNEDSEGNQVKLFYLPYAVENIIKEAITEGILDEDELCSTPFVIKKTKNSGGWGSYENSYFERKQIDEEELEYLEDMTVNQFDYSTLDVIPQNTTTEELVEWLANAETKYEEALGKASGSNNPSKGDDNDDDRPVKKQSSKLDAMREKAKKKKAQESETEEQKDDSPEPEQEEPEEAPWEDDGDQQESDEGDEEEEQKDESQMSAREKLLAMKNRKRK